MKLFDILRTIKPFFVKTRKTNVFRTDYKKNVLISFVTTPFMGKEQKYSHTVYDECLTAAEIFRDLGYNVDVVDLFSKEPIDYAKYDIVYGQGYNLERSFLCDSSAKRIYYANGCNTIYSNLETIKKIRDFQTKTKRFAINSGRITWYTQDLQYLLSDKVIVLGNDFTKSTYQKFSPGDDRFVNLGAFFYKKIDFDVNDRDYNSARKHFVWFGSLGALHKGLDLALDYFIEHPEYTLHVCGKPENEKIFWEYYEPKIKDSKNVILHGFVDVCSESFKELLAQCAFAIFPSVSECVCVSLLTVCGCGGLIPITSVRSGLELPSDIKVAEDVNKQDFEELISYYLNKDSYELRRFGREVKDFINENYTLEKYKKNLRTILEQECL